MTNRLASAGDAVDDAQLIAAVRRGNDHAFEQLYRRYSAAVGRFVGARVRDSGRAEDLVQEIFLSALRRLRATDTDIAFRPWIFEIAKNAAIDHYRRTKRAEEVSIHEHEALRPADQLRLIGRPHTRPEVAILHKERFDQLCGAFAELSKNHHRVLVLRELEGLSYREIAQEMDMTRPAVESALFRARRRLAQEYARAEAVA
ncbi:MAG TPA: sigma-70 family RNA polymerase sigma factor [Thermoleophilaceae bacterium]|nr:sigma-70 family RNA polymerase sigma factor [Thermoleophilaceae bacterium]